jgi:hypothetical protein
MIQVLNMKKAVMTFTVSVLLLISAMLISMPVFAASPIAHPVLDRASSGQVRMNHNDTMNNDSAVNAIKFNGSAINASRFNVSMYNASRFNSSMYNASRFNGSMYNTSRFNSSADHPRINDAYVRLGGRRLTQYNDLMTKQDSGIARWSAAGFNVSGMQCVENGARANVISPLQTVNGTDNGTMMKDQLRSTCLDNGSAYSYHYSAKMDLERLTSVSEKLSTLTNNTTIQGQLADVNADLASVSSTLDSVGTSPYSGTQEQQVSSGLKSASQELKDVIREINQDRNRQE